MLSNACTLRQNSVFDKPRFCLYVAIPIEEKCFDGEARKSMPRASDIVATCQGNYYFELLVAFQNGNDSRSLKSAFTVSRALLLHGFAGESKWAKATHTSQRSSSLLLKRFRLSPAIIVWQSGCSSLKRQLSGSCLMK